jgi:hypothetical protein
MIGGGYYVITGDWSWNVVIASLPMPWVTGVIFGKHIDKWEMDKRKHPHSTSFTRRESFPLQHIGNAGVAVCLCCVPGHHRLLYTRN